MYVPGHFEETRLDELHRLVDENPFGALVVRGPNGLDANHLPFLLEPSAGAHGRLLAHVARANPLWREAKDGDEALVIFRAEDAYVSPNWYPSKHALHRQVPTWNYRVVHVHGTVTIRDDERFVRGVVARLTRRHEAATGDARPWKMSDSEAAYIDDMLTRIVGIEVAIARIVGKWKLSQNKDALDREGAAAALESRHPAMAAAIRATLAREDDGAS